MPSPPERKHALWQPTPRSGRLRLLYKHSSDSHTFSKGHAVSFVQAENALGGSCREEGRHHRLPLAGGGSDWNRKEECFSNEFLGSRSVQLLVHPAAFLTALQVSQPRSPPARFCSSWHIFPIYSELLGQPGFPATPISSFLPCSHSEECCRRQGRNMRALSFVAVAATSWESIS